MRAAALQERPGPLTAPPENACRRVKIAHLGSFVRRDALSQSVPVNGVVNRPLLRQGRFCAGGHHAVLRLPRCVDGAIAVVRRGPGPPDCGRRLAGADHSHFLFLGGRLGSQIESASLARHPPRSWHPFAVSIARAVIIFPDPTRARTGVARMAGRRVLERGGAPTNRVADACAKRDASQIYPGCRLYLGVE